MKRILALGRSGEGIGLLAGLLMLGSWPIFGPGPISAPVLLAIIVLLSSVAALAVGVFCRRARIAPDGAVKCGVRSAGIAALVSTACFAVTAESRISPAAVGQSLVAGSLSILPAMLGGMLASTLAALSTEPTSSGTEGEVTTAAALPKAIGRTIRAAVCLIALRGLCAPYFASERAARDSLAKAKTPPAMSSAPKPAEPSVIRYDPPPEMASAHALQWIISKRRLIGGGNGRVPLVSGDDRLLAYVQSGTLNVADLLSAEPATRIRLPFEPARLAFDPKGERVFAASEAEPHLVGVAEVARRDFVTLPQPKWRAIPEGTLSWDGGDQVKFDPPNAVRVALDLKSLELDASPDALSSPREWWLIRLADRSNWNKIPVSGPVKFRVDFRVASAELPETTGGQEWDVRKFAWLAASDPKRRCSAFFPNMEVHDGDAYLPSRDGSRLLRMRNGQIEAFYFGVREAPPLAWTVTMPHGPDACPDGRDIVRKLREKRLLVAAYAPMINPLTGAVAGPDRSRVKAVFLVKSWTGGSAEVVLSDEFDPLAAGDIVADLFTIAADKWTLRVLGTPHRWWAPLPSPGPDAASPSNVPTFEETKEIRESLKELAKPPDPQVQEAEQSQDPQVKEIREFISAHHRKAGEMDPKEFVQDYAEKTDYLGRGAVDRKFVYREEWNYRKFLKSLIEEPEGAPQIRKLPSGRLEVSYSLRDEWMTTNGKGGGGTFEVTLELTKTGSGWLIVKERRSKKP